MLQEIFFVNLFLTCFILVLFLFFKGANSEEYQKKNPKRIMFISFDISQAS